MRRLVKKANVLPVVARADSLTDDALTAIKAVVRRDIEAAGLDLGVFGPIKADEQADTQRNSHVHGNGNDAAHTETGDRDDPAPTNGSATPTPHAPEDDAEPEDERRSRPVIKLRGTRNPFRMPWARSRSRTRIEDAEPADEPTSVETMDTESVASVRFSAQRVAKTHLADMLPFAVIAPETSRRRRLAPATPVGTDDRHSIHTDAGAAPSEDAHTSESATSSPIATLKHAPFLAGPPADLRGVFVRKYRWGTVDVLSPEHCDFAALRTAVLSTHMKVCSLLSVDDVIFTPDAGRC